MNFNKALEWSNLLKKETFFTNPLFILQNCFINDNMLFENEAIEGKFPLLVYSDIYEDISDNFISTGFDEDLPDILKKYVLIKKEDLGLEFFYSTNDWINLEGKKFRSIRKKINKFEREHDFKILTSYPHKKIISFLNAWAEEKRKKTLRNLQKPYLNMNWLNQLRI